MAPKQRNDAAAEVASLEELIRSALDTAFKARRHNANLAGRNHYADKFAKLRIAATQSYRDMTPSSPGEVTALGEMLDIIFDPATPNKQRTATSREFLYKIGTSKHLVGSESANRSEVQFFPLSILTSTRRTYLERIGSEINVSFAHRCYAACMVMMRRLLEVTIIEAFENNQLSAKIKDGSGNYYYLDGLVTQALSENTWNLSRNVKTYLPQLKDFGNLSAHGRYYHPRHEDVERMQALFRVSIEEMLHHARLL